MATYSEYKIKIDSGNVWTLDEVIQNYANHHEVEIDAVDVSFANYEDGASTVCLSLDKDGKSHGCDESFEIESISE